MRNVAAAANAPKPSKKLLPWYFFARRSELVLDWIEGPAVVVSDCALALAASARMATVEYMTVGLRRSGKVRLARLSVETFDQQQQTRDGVYCCLYQTPKTVSTTCLYARQYLYDERVLLSKVKARDVGVH